MKRFLLACLSNALMIIIPLAGKPFLITNYKIIILIAAGIFIWLTQPAVTAEETKQNQSKDKSSVLLILIMSLVSVVTPVIIWAYFNTDHTDIINMSSIGYLMMISGLALRAWSVRTLGKYFTPTVQIQKEHKLILKGPYKLVRHPSYLGAYLAIISCSFVLNTITGIIIATLAMTMAYAVRISIEEKELKAYFGEAYDLYSKRTKKIIPFIW